jgi:chromosome segregation ATPase
MFQNYSISDYLTRQVIAKQEKEIYLEEKLTETSRDLEVAERKVKDLQLRLKRFVKDDEAKDLKMRQMEREYKDLTEQMQRIEESLDSKSKNNNVGEVQSETTERQRKKSSSKVCIIL